MLMRNDWKSQEAGSDVIGFDRRVGCGVLRALLASILVAAVVACAPSHRLTPKQCGIIGAGLGAAGGAAGGAEYADKHSTGAGVGIGVAGTVAGAALGWGLCRLLLPAAAPEPEPEVKPEFLPPPPILEPEPEPEPLEEPPPPPEPAPIPAPIPETPAPPPPTPDGPCAGTIELPGLRFALGQVVIRLESFDILDRALERLAMCDDEHVRVEGHSDSTGPDDLNQRLSRERAEAVQKYLVEAGIDARAGNAPSRRTTRLRVGR